MTRLIDTDDIEYTMLYKENWITGCGVEAQGVWKTTIDEMPTVDAIPVSFIFNRMGTINSEYINIQRLIDTEPETAARRIVIATDLLREYNALRGLMRAWKEKKEGWLKE